MENIYLNKEKSKEIAETLNVYLANLMILSTKLRNYHWNVVGKEFLSFHEELDSMYHMVADYIDAVAEKIVMLGYKPIATLEGAIEMSTITESPSQTITPDKISVDLIEDFNEMISIARYTSKMAGDNYDESTSGILGDHIRFLEKMIWFLSAYMSEPVMIN